MLEAPSSVWVVDDDGTRQISKTLPRSTGKWVCVRKDGERRLIPWWAVQTKGKNMQPTKKELKRLEGAIMQNSEYREVFLGMSDIERYEERGVVERLRDVEKVWKEKYWRPTNDGKRVWEKNPNNFYVK